jgi:cytidine deaminase
MLGLSEGDRQLIDAACNKLKACYRPRRHEIGAALRTHSGQIYTAVNLDTRLRRASVCAEAVVIGMAVGAGDTEIEAIVAVNRDEQVVAPCGICRELLADYAPAARIIVPSIAGPEPLTIGVLLPHRYNKDGTP